MNSERRTRLLILLGSAVILAIQTGAMYVVSMPSMASLATAQWLAEHVANGSQLVYEFQAGEAHRLTAKWPNSATFIWRLVPTIDSETFGQWLAQGFHYVLIDERTFPWQSFDQRVQSLIGQHATLIYESHNPLNLWPRQAVLWTFRPDHLLNLTFDGSLRLVGYSIEEDNSGP
ncbi:MAG TPA: hypothetical protein VMT24_05470, partial [Aggregatilineaceae bacterium]|nr:hypothetical protein [Aggregatilineaceae bacterium]